jgi:hypothetical protein
VRRDAPLTLRAPVGSPHVVVAWSLPTTPAPRDLTQELAAELVETMFGEWLERQPAVERAVRSGSVDDIVGCERTWGAPGALLSCVVVLVPGLDAGQALDLLRVSKGEARSGGALVDEVLHRLWVRERRALLLQAEWAGDPSGGWASEAALHAHLSGSASWLADRGRDQDETHGDDVVDLVSTWIRDDRRVVVVVEPGPARGSAPAEDLVPLPLVDPSAVPASDAATLRTLSGSSRSAA